MWKLDQGFHMWLCHICSALNFFFLFLIKIHEHIFIFKSKFYTQSGAQALDAEIKSCVLYRRASCEFLDEFLDEYSYSSIIGIWRHNL